MITPELQDYISKSRASGMSDAQIRQALLAQGWPENNIAEVLTRQNTGERSVLSLVIILALLFFGIEYILTSFSFMFYAAHLFPFVFILGHPAVIFAVIFIPISILLLTRKYKKIGSVKDLLAVELFYFLSIIVPIIGFLYYRRLDLGQGLPLNFFPLHFLIIIILSSSIIFWFQIRARWRDILVLSIATIGIILVAAFPIIRFYYSQSTIDPEIQSFVSKNSVASFKTEILLSLPSKNLVVFSSRIENQPFSSEDNKYKYREILTATGIKYGNKIGWTYRFPNPKFAVEPSYNFDSTDAYLYSQEFLNKLQSQENTKYTAYRDIKKSLQADPDTPFYQVNQNNY